MILAGAHAGPADLGRFRFEAEAIARLNHPNVVQIHEVGEQGGLPFLAMEYCDGGSLAKKLGGTPLPPREAARLLAALARAVQVAHDKGLVHRDLKPANVLLAADGTEKVTDFGLAKDLAASTATAPGAILGTPSYMAPELAGAGCGKVGPAADVYGLGAILYECLAGRPPFRGATPLDTLLQVREDEPVPPARLQRHVPRDLETICLKCLQKAPARRYASAGALADDLERFRRGEPVRARPVSAPVRAWRWCRREPALAALVLVLLAAAGTSSALAVLAEQRARAEEMERRKARRAEELADQRADEEARARKSAEEQRRRAERAEDRAERLLYSSQIALAQTSWQENRADVAWGYLNATRRDLRGWEYRYLSALFTRSQRVIGIGQQGAPVFSISFSPDGKHVVSGSDDGTVKVWDAATGKDLLSLKGHRFTVWTACFSPDGKRLASGGDDRTVRVWDAATGKELLVLKGHADTVRCVCFSPDGRRLASASRDGTVSVWDAESGQMLRVLSGRAAGPMYLLGQSLGAQALAPAEGPLGPLAHVLVAGKIATLEEVAVGPARPVWGVCFSPDGKRLAVASEDRTVGVWDAGTGQRLLSLKGHLSEVRSVSFSPDGKRLASASTDGTVRLWDPATGKELPMSPLRGHSGLLFSISFSPDGRRLASGGDDRTVRVWDAATGKELLALKGHTHFVWRVAFSPDGRRLASLSPDEHAVRFWDTDKSQEVLSLPVNIDPVPSVGLANRGPRWSMSFSPDGKRLAGSAGKTVRVWDTVTGKEVLVLKGHTNLVHGVNFSPDGRRLASASDDRTVRVWDAVTGQEVLAFRKEHTYRVLSVSFSPDGRRLASDSAEGTVKVWDAATGKELLVLKGPIFGVSFSPDGKRLASVCMDSTVRVWDAATGKELLVLEGHTNLVHGVNFSPDGRRLASASDDRTVRVWDTVTGNEELVLKGLTDRVYSVCFSPDGRRLASANQDHTVRVWDAAAGQEVLVLKGHTSAVWGVCFSPDGKRLASVSQDRTVRVWDATMDQ
jgi:WD40 repeat protein